MESKNTILLVLIASVAINASSQATDYSATAFGSMVWSLAKIPICGLFYAFWLTAGALGSLMIVYSAVKWITESDDPGARKNAKDLVKHVMIALIIVVMASVVVDLASGHQLVPCLVE